MGNLISAPPPAPRVLWEHENPASTHCAKFIRFVNSKRGRNMALQDWSVGFGREHFWADALEYFAKNGLIVRGTYNHVPKFFTGVRLNVAENVLYGSEPGRAGSQTTRDKPDDGIALTEIREGGSSVRHMTWAELRLYVGHLASAMRAAGVVKGDRIGAVMSNSINTLSIFLAAASIGAIFSSTSTDTGSKGVLDRLLQVRPRFVFADDAALYNGKTFDLIDKMKDVVDGLEVLPEFDSLVSVPRWDKPLNVSHLQRTVTFEAFLSKGRPCELTFEQLEFAEPALIVYSSGTTGQPKCLTHSVGGFVFNACKESMLHRNIGKSHVVLQYTTTGWVAVLFHGARSVLYDGSPFQPDLTTVTLLGVSPRFFQTLASAKVRPREVADLSALRHVTTTGMVMPEALFEWFYSPDGFGPGVWLGNMSGGTDIAGCFALENPLEPLYAGGCMGPSLGLKVEVYDGSIEASPQSPLVPPRGKPVKQGEPGELVSSLPFPNMPVLFWPGDEASQKKYFDSYFARFDNVWTHGDYIQEGRQGQIIFLGRADGVLNPSGVRFGSAEIYSVLEKHFPNTIVDSIVVGQRRPRDTDERVMLFVKLHDKVALTRELTDAIRGKIASERSRRHVPKFIFETPEIPTTVNMKKVELPVKQIVSGKRIKPSGTLVNPKSLDFFYQFARVEDLPPLKSKL